MSHKWKIAAATAAVLALLALLALAVQRHMVAAARAEKFCDAKWVHVASPEELDEWRAWFEGLAPAEKRTLAHEALARAGADEHDAFLVLVEHGTEESVPLLLDWLKKQADLEKGTGILCTRDHCLEALMGITGMDLGCNYSDWQDWEKKR